MTSPTPFALELEFCTVDQDNVWQAIGDTLATSIQPCDAILQAKYIGRTPHNWPIMSIVFASIECAKAFVFAYLGYGLHNKEKWDVYADDEIEQHIRTGRFLCGR
jgi:hypothetical protein